MALFPSISQSLRERRSYPTEKPEWSGLAETIDESPTARKQMLSACGGGEEREGQGPFRGSGKIWTEAAVLNQQCENTLLSGRLHEIRRNRGITKPFRGAYLAFVSFVCLVAFWVRDSRALWNKRIAYGKLPARHVIYSSMFIAYPISEIYIHMFGWFLVSSTSSLVASRIL